MSTARPSNSSLSSLLAHRGARRPGWPPIRLVCRRPRRRKGRAPAEGHRGVRGGGRHPGIVVPSTQNTGSAVIFEPAQAPALDRCSPPQQTRPRCPVIPGRIGANRDRWLITGNLISHFPFGSSPTVAAPSNDHCDGRSRGLLTFYLRLCSDSRVSQARSDATLT
jgi:hypothetical protein